MNINSLRDRCPTQSRGLVYASSASKVAVAHRDQFGFRNSHEGEQVHSVKIINRVGSELREAIDRLIDLAIDVRP